MRRSRSAAEPTNSAPATVIERQPTLEARLSVLDRAQLQALVEALAARQPNLIELIDAQLNLGGVAPAPSPLAKRSATPARRTTAVATTSIHRQVRTLLRSYGYLGGVADGVREIAEQARPHIEAGDGNSALAILEAVTDEYVNGWTELDDSDGEAGDLFDDLSALWAEAILSADLTPAERETWAALQADERVIIEPALLLAPAAEAAQRGVAPIERAGRQVLLGGEERHGCLMCQAGDRLFVVLGDKRGEILGVALACSGSEARARQKALECGAETRQRWDDVQRSRH